MRSDNQTASTSKKSLWAGRIISGLVAHCSCSSTPLRRNWCARPAPVVEGTVKLGYSESVMIPLGIVLLACTLLYVFPRTAVLGAILLTGYLGGAVATHVPGR